LKGFPNTENIIYGTSLSDYINTQAVRTAMNIPTTVQTFSLCSSSVGDNYHPEPEGSKWIYTILRHKLKILFYSGDTDGALPTYGTKTWINSLNWARTNATR
jgi:hypothetical protein